MTNEQFRQEYHLLDRVGQGSVVTHHAQSATGAMVVMVHFLQGTAEENSRVLRDLGTLDANHRARVLKVAEVDGQTAIVTKFILDFTTFNEWLASGISSTAAQVVTDQEPKTAPTTERTQKSSQLAPVEPPPSPEPGEFTRVFQLPPVSTRTSATAPDFVSPPPAPPQIPEPQPDTPGEFTRIFRGLPIQSAAVSVPSPPPESQRIPPPVQPIPRASSVQEPPAVSPAAVPMPPVQPAPRPASDLSSFDRPGLTSSPVSPAPPPPPAPAGEYTRLFGKPEAMPLPPSAPFSDPVSRPVPASLDWSIPSPKSVPAGDDSYFERLAGGPAAQSYEPLINNQSSFPPPSFGGRSEFTRIISAPQAMPSLPAAGVRPGPQPTPVAPSPPQKGNGDRVLLFWLIGVLILTIIVVAVFAFLT